MRFLDRFLQSWRARVALPWIPFGSQVLDIGCHQGEFLDMLGDHIGPSVGIDPMAAPKDGPRYQIRTDSFREPSSLPETSFDKIVLPATLEPMREKDPLGRECYKLLRSGGRLIVTAPSPIVDEFVHLLCRLRLIDGMSLEEHHGFDPRSTPDVFGRHGFLLEHRRHFQLGMNHLFVLRRPPNAAVGEISCPTNDPPETSSINIRRSVSYGCGVLGTVLRYRLHHWGLPRRRLF